MTNLTILSDNCNTFYVPILDNNPIYCFTEKEFGNFFSDLQK